MFLPFTMKYCNAPRLRAFSGLDTNPSILTIDVSVTTGSTCFSMLLPNSMPILCSSAPPISWCSTTSLWVMVNSIWVFTSARRSNSCIILLSSTESFFRNLRRAGTLKNRFFTIMFDPGAHASGCWLSTLEPFINRRVPMESPCRMVRRSTWAIAAIEARASPRNPIVWRENRSDASDIFDVEWRSKARRASVADIPQPLSTTCIKVRPASFNIICILVAPASTAFSTSSFTTEAGRCMTSPAAIWLATESGSSFMTSLFITALI